MLQHHCILVQRMSRQVDAHQLALLVQAVYVAPTFGLRHFGSGDRQGVLTAEEAALGACLVLLKTVTIADKHFAEGFVLGIERKILLAAHLAKAVQCPGQSQVLQVLAIARVEVDALHEVGTPR